MAYSSNRLPSRFPVGTKFVIEGRRVGKGQTQVYSRHLEFPDGTFLSLPERPAKAAQGKAAPAGRARRSRRRAH
jgi:hypothetical protein